MQLNGNQIRQAQSIGNKVWIFICLGICFKHPLGITPLHLVPLALPPSILASAFPSPIYPFLCSLLEISRLFIAGLHYHLRHCPAFLLLHAAWFICCQLFPPEAAALKSFHLRDLISFLSHDCEFVEHINMASLESNSALPYYLGSGLTEALQYLLYTVSGIEEGSLHSLLWQELPLTRSVVKERLAIAAFSPCLCNKLIWS